MLITVAGSHPVELSSIQVRMLMFFGEILDAPPTGPTCPTVQALRRHGLVEQEGECVRFTISAGGRAVLSELLREGGLPLEA